MPQPWRWPPDFRNQWPCTNQTGEDEDRQAVLILTRTDVLAELMDRKSDGEISSRIGPQLA
jgi:hypothetical protein